MHHDDDHPTIRGRAYTLLDCSPCNLHGEGGPPASAVTLASTNDMIIVAMSLEDMRRLTVLLLMALNTGGDMFAGEVLDAHFSVNEVGLFEWPDRGE